MSRPTPANPVGPFQYYDQYGRFTANPYVKGPGLMTPTAYTPVPDGSQTTSSTPDKTGMLQPIDPVTGTSRPSSGDNGGIDNPTANDKSFSEMSEADKIGWGRDLQDMGSFGRSMVSGAVGIMGGMLGAPLGIDTAFGKVAGVNNVSQTFSGAVKDDMDEAMSMASTAEMEANAYDAKDMGVDPGPSYGTDAVGGFDTGEDDNAAMDGPTSGVDATGGFDTGDSEGDGGGGSCVITTQMTTTGYMDRRQYARYLKYCKSRYHGKATGERMRLGYQAWGMLFVAAMRKNPDGYAARTGRWIANTYAEYVNAHLNSTIPPVTSRVLAAILHPVSYIIGLFR